MLELRPSCECCDVALPPESTQARICTFECTFCTNCAQNILHNVCPNCGGGFTPRPIRPARDWRGGFFLGKYPGSTQERFRPVDEAAHERFSTVIKDIPPDQR